MWANEFVTSGADNVNFGIYGPDEVMARAIVNRAIDDWEKVIPNFNYNSSNLSNTFQLTVTGGSIEGRGVTSNILRESSSNKPISARITLDDNGGGTGWFFDQTPSDDVEFTGIASPFQASFVDSSTVGQQHQNDFYRTITHEIGHALGISLADTLLGLNSGNWYIQNQVTGQLYSLAVDTTDDYLGALTYVGYDQINQTRTEYLFDPNTQLVQPFTVVNELWRYQIPGDGTATFTENGGGHFYEGTAAAPVHPNDLMNPGRTVPAGTVPPIETTRQFISDLDVRLLGGRFGYTTMLPSTLNNAHAMLDIQTGQLLVQGSARNNSTGAGTNDTINVQRVNDAAGDNVVVTVSYSGQTYTERVPFAQVTSIIINGNGNGPVIADSITVNSNVSNTIPWQQVQYVVSSNEDRLEDSTSVGGSSTTNGIVDVSTVIPGAQTTLRAAIVEANAAGAPFSIYVGRNKYGLSLTGTGGDTQGDFDITGNVTIVGAGAGATVIDAGPLMFVPDDRIFDVAANGVLKLDRVTLQLGQAGCATGELSGGAVRVQDDGQFDVTQSAILGNVANSNGQGGGIYFAGRGRGSIVNCVITVNESANDQTGGVYLAAAASQAVAGKVIVSRSIIARNQQVAESYFPDVYAATNRTFTSGLPGENGNNRLGNWASGFSAAKGDMVGTPAYIVTSIVDTYDGTSDPVNMSLRDAVRQANITAGTQEIWLPAWRFILTRQRNVAANQVELDVAWGDIEFDQSTIIRGINGPSGPTTSVAWMAGAAADKVFELVGDYNVDRNVDQADYNVWRESTSGLAADGDDNGIIDSADYDIWRNHYGNTLQIEFVLGV